MRTPIFENAVNAGLPHRGCVINAGPTWATRVDNALSVNLGHVATLPKMAALQRCQSVIFRALSTRDGSHQGALITLCVNKDTALMHLYMKFLCRMTEICLF